MTTTYIALIADVAASRALPAPARARLQARVRDVARELNARYRAHLAARFAVTLGDELQGLFKTAAPVWEVSHRLRSAFPEVDWVVACGRGPRSSTPSATASSSPSRVSTRHSPPAPTTTRRCTGAGRGANGLSRPRSASGARLTLTSLPSG